MRESNKCVYRSVTWKTVPTETLMFKEKFGYTLVQINESNNLGF